MKDNKEFHRARCSAFKEEFKKESPSLNILREDGWWLGFYDGWVAAMESMKVALIADGVAAASPVNEKSPRAGIAIEMGQSPETIAGFPVAYFDEIQIANPEDAAKFGSCKAADDFTLVREGDRFIFRK